MRTKLNVKFGNQEHGWFPITISLYDTVVEIDASDVPVNPVIQLIEALERCFIRGEASEAWMYVEPNYYQWVFSVGGEKANFKLYYVEEFRSITMPGNNERRETLELEYEGEQQDVLLPIWRGIREFASREIGYENELVSLDNKVEYIKCM